MTFKPDHSSRKLQWIPAESAVITASDSFFGTFIAIALVLVGFMSGYVVALQMQPSEVDCTFSVKDGTGNAHEWSRICKIKS